MHDMNPGFRPLRPAWAGPTPLPAAVPQSGPLLELPWYYRGLIALFLLVYAVLITVRSTSNSPLVLASSLLWIFSAAFPILFYRKGWGVENPLVLMALLGLLTMVVKHTAGMLNGLPYHVALPGFNQRQLDQIYAFGNVLNALSVWMVYAGFFLGSQLPVPRLDSGGRSKESVLFLIGILFAMAFGALALLIWFSGDLNSHLLNVSRGAAGRQFRGDVGGLGPVAMMVNLVGVAGMLSITSKQNHLITFAVCAAGLVMLYVTEGRRSAVIYPLVLFLIAYALTHRQIPAFRGSMVLLACFVVIGVGSALREANWGTSHFMDYSALKNITIESVYERTSTEIIARANTSSTVYAILGRVPKEIGHLYGAGYLRWLNLFIPRFIWRTKPRGIDVEAGMVFYGVDWGMPPGGIGQAYWEFNVFGVAGVYFLLGLAKRFFYNCLVRNKITFATLALYIVGVFYMEPDQNSFRNMVFVFFPMLLFLLFFGCIRLRLR
jgi:oligosaccharide repeat unit polymerase